MHEMKTCAVRGAIQPGGDCMCVIQAERWTNPPHRSHLCHSCGHIWRPADVPTNGVEEIKTKGKGDSPVPYFDTATEAQGYALEAIWQFCPELRICEDGQTLMTPANVEKILRHMGWTPPCERRTEPNSKGDH